eukprot:336963_1
MSETIKQSTTIRHRRKYLLTDTKHQRKYLSSSDIEDTCPLSGLSATTCQLIQWTFLILILLIFSTICYTTYSAENIPSYNLPTCSSFHGNWSILQHPKSLNNLLYTQFIPIISTSVKTLKNKINNININNNQYKHSNFKHTSIVIINEKRKEFEAGVKQLWNKMKTNDRFKYIINNKQSKLLQSNIINNTYNPYNITFELFLNSNNKNTKNIPLNLSKISEHNLMFIIIDNLWDFTDIDDINDNIFQCYNNIKENYQIHAVMFNEYAITEYNGLFIPFIGSNSLHINEALAKGIDFINMFDSFDFRLVYNYVESIYDIHFQFLSKMGKLPIEIIGDILTTKNDGLLFVDYDLIIREIIGYPIYGFIYERNINECKKWNINYKSKMCAIGLDKNILLDPLNHCIEYLKYKNISYNLLFNYNKIFLFPMRQNVFSQYKIVSDVMTVSGWIRLFDENMYNAITMKQLWNDMKSAVSIQDNIWNMLKTNCLSF